MINKVTERHLQSLMKTLLLTSTLTLSLMFSSASSAEWTEMTTSHGGAVTWYLDLDRIRKHSGYVYYWTLQDYLKPDKYGDYSDMFHTEGDCKRLRKRSLSLTSYKQPMGGGKGEGNSSIAEGNQKWEYAEPDSVDETVLNRVCAQ